MKYSLEVLIFSCIFLRASGILFERFSGKKVDEALSKELKSRNVLEQCTIEARPCTPHEGRRIDGTCNNYKYPSKGSAGGPYLRLLKPEQCTIEARPCTPHEGRRIDGTCNNYKYPSKGSAGGPYLRLLKPEYGLTSDNSNSTRDIRKGKRGLPSARKVRIRLQPTGRTADNTFTVAAVHFLEFIGKDVSALSGELDFLKDRQHCCQPEGQTDPRCIPIIVQADPNDPLNATDIRCLNLTRAATFQDAGCTNITPPEQINRHTPVLDLSTIYGIDDKALDSIREYNHGLLKLQKRGERYVPLDIISANITGTKDDAVRTLTSRDVCSNNKGNKSCYLFGFPEVGNSDLRTTTMAIFFMREHNRIAKALQEMHPCWTDDRLFKVARQINIATASNIFMYELLPALLGYNNMVNFGLISDQVEYVTVYEKEELPLVYAEYEIATRFFHTLLDGRIKRYDGNYRLVGELSLGETIFEQGLIEQGENFEEINRGTFYQSAAKVDSVQDPEVSEKYFGMLQKAHDLAAIDIQRGRDLGVRSYNDYRPVCGLKAAKKFKDFLDVMDYEKMQTLQSLYSNVSDVDLLAGIIAESLMRGTFVGPTLFCIMSKQLQLFRHSDRFWYERGDQVHSFSLEQLQEIRRANMARLACDNAEGILSIQLRAFHKVGYGNMHLPCTHIPGPDLSKWQDTSCKSQKDLEKQKESGKGQGAQRTEPPSVAVEYNAFLNSILSLRPSLGV